jgi:hypothetical protein
MACEMGHPSWTTFLSSAPTVRRCRSGRQGKSRNESVLQHPMSKNIASGRSFNNSMARGYAGIFAIVSFANLNPRMQGYG